MKRREYLQYLISVRDEEHQARMLGLKIEAKSIEEVRAEFEKQFGSIYINNNNYEETEL